MKDDQLSTVCKSLVEILWRRTFGGESEVIKFRCSKRWMSLPRFQSSFKVMVKVLLFHFSKFFCISHFCHRQIKLKNFYWHQYDHRNLYHFATQEKNFFHELHFLLTVAKVHQIFSRIALRKKAYKPISRAHFFVQHKLFSLSQTFLSH